MAIDERNLDEARKLNDARKLDDARKPGFGIGLLKGMAVTLKHLFKHNTVIQYPDEKQDLPSRTRGVIALKEENCTVCMLCARECPDWCIYIDSHKEQIPAKRQGGRPRKRNVLDRFAIDYALCMYCGICVEVCPYDALFWSREFEYAEYDIRELTHEKEKLSDWMASVLPPPELEAGAELPGSPVAAATATAAPSRPATPASTPTQTSSAAETRPEQASDAPKAPSAAPTASKQETADEKSPQATSETQVEEGIAPDKAEALPNQVSASRAEAAPTTDAPSAEAKPAVVEDPAGAAQAASPPEPVPSRQKEPLPSEAELDAVYKEVLDEQLARGSSPQVAEARAKVARVKAERRVGRAPTPVHTDKPVPSAPTRGEPPTPTPAGAPAAEEPKPEQGPVAATEPEATAEPEAEATPQPEAETAPEPRTEDAQPEVLAAEDPEAAYERVLAEERNKGSSDAVATGRAKAARVRAQKGTKGPQG